MFFLQKYINSGKEYSPLEKRIFISRTVGGSAVCVCAGVEIPDKQTDTQTYRKFFYSSCDKGLRRRFAASRGTMLDVRGANRENETNQVYQRKASW